MDITKLISENFRQLLDLNSFFCFFFSSIASWVTTSITTNIQINRDLQLDKHRMSGHLKLQNQVNNCILTGNTAGHLCHWRLLSERIAI